MAQSNRMGMTDVQKAELWHRWRNGKSIHDISRAIGEYRSAIHTVLHRHGGFTPPERKRSSCALTLAEREEISRGLSAGHSIRRTGARRAERRAAAASAHTTVLSTVTPE